jgi:hypothetical protein
MINIIGIIFIILIVAGAIVMGVREDKKRKDKEK